MKKILFLLAMLTMMLSCNKNSMIDNKMFSNLSVEDMASITKEYPQFADMYKGYIEGLSLSKSDSAKYYNITYRRMLDFYKVQQLIVPEEYAKKYEIIADSFHNQVDILVDKWIENPSTLNLNWISKIFPDYKGLISARKASKNNDFSKLSYTLKKYSFVQSYFGDEYYFPALAGEKVAEKELITKDSLCYSFFKLTKEGKRFTDEFIHYFTSK